MRNVHSKEWYRNIYPGDVVRFNFSYYNEIDRSVVGKITYIQPRPGTDVGDLVRYVVIECHDKDLPKKAGEMACCDIGWTQEVLQRGQGPKPRRLYVPNKRRLFVSGIHYAAPDFNPCRTRSRGTWCGPIREIIHELLQNDKRAAVEVMFDLNKAVVLWEKTKVGLVKYSDTKYKNIAYVRIKPLKRWLRQNLNRILTTRKEMDAKEDRHLKEEEDAYFEELAFDSELSVRDDPFDIELDAAMHLNCHENPVAIPNLEVSEVRDILIAAARKGGSIADPETHIDWLLEGHGLLSEEEVTTLVRRFENGLIFIHRKSALGAVSGYPQDFEDGVLKSIPGVMAPNKSIETKILSDDEMPTAVKTHDAELVMDQSSIEKRLGKDN